MLANSHTESGVSLLRPVRANILEYTSSMELRTLSALGGLVPYNLRCCYNLMEKPCERFLVFILANYARVEVCCRFLFEQEDVLAHKLSTFVRNRDGSLGSGILGTLRPCMCLVAFGRVLRVPIVARTAIHRRVCQRALHGNGLRLRIRRERSRRIGLTRINRGNSTRLCSVNLM